jgi:hypothetical protein
VTKTASTASNFECQKFNHQNGCQCPPVKLGEGAGSVSTSPPPAVSERHVYPWEEAGRSERVSAKLAEMYPNGYQSDEESLGKFGGDYGYGYGRSIYRDARPDDLVDALDAVCRDLNSLKGWDAVHTNNAVPECHCCYLSPEGTSSYAMMLSDASTTLEWIADGGRVKWRVNEAEQFAEMAKIFESHGLAISWDGDMESDPIYVNFSTGERSAAEREARDMSSTLEDEWEAPEEDEEDSYGHEYDFLAEQDFADEQ